MQAQTNPLQHRRSRTVPIAIACAGVGLSLLVACEATGLGKVMAGVGSNLLASAAKANFQPEVASDIDQLLEAVASAVGDEPKGGEPLPPLGSGLPPLDPVGTTPASSSAGGLPPLDPLPPLGSGAPLPPLDSSLPPLGDPYATARPIRLEVALLREVVVDGRPYPIPIEDGAVLRDGVGRAEAGDNLKISFEVDQTAYVYVIAVDATAWTQPVFPSSMASHSNPVSPGRSYEVPAGDEWIYLDDYRGIETLYFIASPSPRRDLEDVMERLAGRRREWNTGRPVTLGEEALTVVTRGLAGVRPGAGVSATATDGSLHDVDSIGFLGVTPGADLVITRWFRHE